VLIGEVIRARDRGKAVGLVQAGWAIGWGAAALLYAWAFSVLPAATAWRALFLFGLVPALLVLVIRRYVKEPEVYRHAKAAQQSEGDKPSLGEIFSPRLLSTTLRAALLTTGAQGGYYAITTWLPTFLKTERHLTVMGTGGYLATIIVGSYIGYLSSAYLTDRLGRKPNFILFAAGSMAIAFAYTSLNLTDHSMLWLGFPLGFFASGIFAGMGAFLTELFPTRVRGSGQGFCYNVGRAIGALFPFLIGALAKQYGLGTSIGVFAVAAYGVLIVAALTLPETRGRELESA
jgi:MFS family permease